MEIPDKIHIQPNAHDGWFEGNIPNGLPNGLFVEYIHKDAFIEKATSYIQQHWIWNTKMIEDFKKYMEE